ncbi:uncharacterized protein LOC107043443 [Diachasma alloeum]|uniref:uncharacterized protein LOC107043443 n=1 Tax=Diachasma alloeum TaxID=454923 RepID=UPI00073829D6|nr:uncharacterized protein LOC107043443 [Diachasma alloeum]
MLVRPIVVILWLVVASIATPPPGYITGSENDKDPPTYRYTYTIGNDNGVGQGKVETRSGELANGRYYINGEQSSTDVKYFADEWGYHPLVKYSASTGHSVANAQLALGEHVVKALVNGTNFADDSPVIQPPFPNNPTIYQANNGEEQNVKGIQEEEVTETHVTEGINDASLTTLEETLIIENSGSFGQRVPDTESSRGASLKQNETHHTTPGLPRASQSITHHVSAVTPAISIKNSSLNDDSSIYNYKTALESIREYFNVDSKEEINYKDPLHLQLFRQEFTSSPLANQSNSSPESGDNSNAQLLEKPGPQVSPRFSKPIVVAEVPNSEAFQYSTTFPCNDLNDESTGSITSSTIDETMPPSTTPLSTLSSDTAVLVTPKLYSQSRITTSSVILNPIQVGVALVNAGEAHLISSDTDRQLKFGDAIEATNSEKEALSSKNIVTSGSDIEISNEAYEGIKSKFNGHDETTNTDPSVDQTVVIQKSRELYHNTPVEEIHYPAEIASQVVTINQLSPGYLNIPGYESARQVERGKTYADIGNGNFGHQSIADRPELLLQELQTSPEGGLHSQADQQEKNNAANFANSGKSIENYVPPKNIHGVRSVDENATGETNFYTDTRIKQDNVYSAFELEKLLENALVNAQQTGGTQEALKIRENNSQDHTKSSLQRLLDEERQQNVYAQGTHIISNTVPTTEIEMKEISREIEKPTLQYSLSQDLGKSTIYIHGPTEQGLLLDIGNYASQTIRGRENPLETDVSNVKKLQDQNMANAHKDVSQIYQFHGNRILEKPVTALKPYPIPVERIVEKRVPHPVHKLVPQLYPVHILQQYPVEKILEKPAAIPVAVEKVVEKKVHAPQPYSVETPIKPANPLELTNYIENSINIPYGVQYGVSYQQIMNPPTNNLYDNNPIDQQIQTNVTSQQFQGYYYDKPLVPPVNPRYALTKRYGSLNQLSNNKQSQNQPQQQLQQFTHLIYPKKIHFANQMVLPLHSRSNDHQITPHRPLVYRAIDKGTNKNVEYIGPVPLPQHALNLHQQNQVVHPLHQETLRYLATVARSNGAGNFRRARLPDVHYQSRTSNFRQSKMEYGFKPPMVPSVQYDEQTATRVDN